MLGLDDGQTTADNYLRFARLEAAGRSATYSALAEAVAGDPAILGFLDRLPRGKRQPNLLFAASRHVLGAVPDIESLRRLVDTRGPDLAAVMLERRTQTNEPGRCATLLPALALIDGPGPHRGRCKRRPLPQPRQLLVRLRQRASAGSRPRLSDPELPSQRKAICVRYPRRVMASWNRPESARPEGHRRQIVAGMPRVARSTRTGEPHLSRARRRRPLPCAGPYRDLLEQLPGLLQQVPPGATPVVFHSAVLAYVDPATRLSFASLIGDLGVHWLANEAPGVVARVQPPEYDTAPFVLTLNGDNLAYTHPHGDSIDWIA